MTVVSNTRKEHTLPPLSNVLHPRLSKPRMEYLNFGPHIMKVMLLNNVMFVFQFYIYDQKKRTLSSKLLHIIYVSWTGVRFQRQFHVMFSSDFQNFKMLLNKVGTRNTLNRQVPNSDSYIFTLCEQCHVPKLPNMHASVQRALCRFKVSSLVVCLLSLLSLIGAYDLKLCKFIRNPLLIQ